MDPVIYVADGNATDWTDVDVSALATGITNVTLRIVEKVGTLGTQVWIRRNGDTAVVAPYRLIDNGSIEASTSVTSGVFEYKTDGQIDIYVNNYLTSVIEPSTVSGLTGETFPVSVSEIVNLLNGTGPTNGAYTIFGMSIYSTMIDTAISISNNYLYMLLGADSTEWAVAANQTKIKGAIRDMAVLRILGTCAGVAIPTHFNYSAGELTVSKSPNPALNQMIQMYQASVKMWMRILLGKNWTAVGTQTDMTYTNPIYNPDSGYNEITYDAQNS